MTLYLGSGYRCMASGACAFRVMPASGDDVDLDEAARVRRGHEMHCRFRGVAEPIKTSARNIDDRRSELAARRVDLEDRVEEKAGLVFRCVCRVCGAAFSASGGRAAFCAKSACQAKRKSPRRVTA